VETFVRPVSSGANNAEVAATAAGISRTTTTHLRVVPEQVRARVKESRIQASASRMAQDPAAAPVLLQEPKHIVLGLRSVRVRDGLGGSDPSSVVCGDDQSGSSGGQCTDLSKHDDAGGRG
jgi:hypothetical protein